MSDDVTALRAKVAQLRADLRDAQLLWQGCQQACDSMREDANRISYVRHWFARFRTAPEAGYWAATLEAILGPAEKLTEQSHNVHSAILDDHQVREHLDGLEALSMHAGTPRAIGGQIAALVADLRHDLSWPLPESDDWAAKSRLYFQQGREYERQQRSQLRVDLDELQQQARGVLAAEVERRKLVWTAEPPTKPGPYWWRMPGLPDDPYLVEVRGHYAYPTRQSVREMDVRHCGGEWCPLPEPPP